MEQKTVKKIVIIGPESTGKSTLTKQLSAHYHTIACPEYARQYLNENGTAYSFDDLLAIAKGQLALEEKLTKEVLNNQLLVTSNQLLTHNSQLLFIDTDMYVMKVWCEYVFGKCHQFILNEIVNRQYDLYLLCNIDLPWVKDALREYPDEKPRRELYNIYKDLLTNQTTPWVDISGNYGQRLQKAIEAVDML